MTKSIRDVMTPNPARLPGSALLVDAARTMRDANVGGVIVVDGNKVCGVVTDRDVIVRAIAESLLADLSFSNCSSKSTDALCSGKKL